MSSRKLIVVVEDDPAVRALVERALSRIYQVESFADGASAARRFEQEPVPDLLVCDVMMPGLDGIALARTARKNPLLRQMPIVFLTARATPKDVIQGIQAGAKHYITKPFKIDDLMQKVGKLLGA